MARTTNNLTVPEVRALNAPGRYADGGGLYLVVSAGGSKQWAFLFRWSGRRLEMGLGGTGAVTLAKAREKAREAREQIASGMNPIDARRALAEIPTFGAMADEVIATKSAGFRRAKSAAIWRRALNDYGASLRPIRVDAVDTAAVLKVLKPIWMIKQESAQKARGCIEAVLDAAKAKGYRTGENPARWRGQLDHLLAKRRKLTRGHNTALAFAAVPGFIADLHERQGMAALALEFLILTTTRTGEVIGARWGEVDSTTRVWSIPAERMKSGRKHRVPLSARALAILETAGEGSNRQPDSHVFPGPKKRGSLVERSLSTNALRALLIRMDVKVTVHGFRSSFRDWAGEASTFPRELAEAALAHVVGDETERAYRRGDALEKRRKLMDAWSSYVTHGAPSKGSNVKPIGRRAA